MEHRQPAVHRTMVVVDVEGFGDRRRTNPDQVAVRDGLYRAVQHAFDNAGLPLTACDCEDRGDGIFILAPAEMLKAPFVDVAPHALAAGLREHNRTHPAEQRIRLRMALHAGEVTYDEHGVTAASVNLAFRLLDAKPVKAALAESPGVLAVITSGWFFDEVVRHSSNTDPATFRPVQVAVKETSTIAWISLPDHSYPPDARHLTVPPGGEPVAPVPRQLPAALRSFIGRADELTALTAALDTADGPGGTMVISAIAGAGGMGKTWLALYWAHQHLDQFPDGQLFVDLRGFSPDRQPMPPGAAVRGFLDAFGVDPSHIPIDLHAQTARYRSLVAGKRMLILLDNAADTTQVTPLLPGSPSATVLITSRRHLYGLITAHGAHQLPVDVLSDTEARALLATRLGAERVAAEPAAVDQLMAYCAGFPLALSIVAGRAHTQPQLPITRIATELCELGLGTLDSGDLAASLPTVLSWSYRDLTGEQAQMFGLLGIAPGPDISLHAAASLTDLPIVQARAVLRGLEEACLVDQTTNGRYRMHDLIRRYAADRANQDLNDAERVAALRRVVEFYLHTAYRADRLLSPRRLPILLNSSAPGRGPQPLPDQVAAMTWFDAEHHCLLASQCVAVEQGWYQAVWQTAWSLNTFHYRRGHRYDRLSTWHAGLDAANRVGDTAVQARAHRQLGRAYTVTGQPDAALNHLHRALTLAESTDEFAGQAHTHHALARAWAQQGDDRRALDHATQALHLFRALDIPAWEAEALSFVGRCIARLGEYDQARPHCEAALAMHRRHFDRDGEATTLDTLGYIAHHTGLHALAVDYYQQALILFRDVDNPYNQANTLDTLGHTQVALGLHDQAGVVWREALALYQAQNRTTDAERVQRQLDALAGA